LESGLSIHKDRGEAHLKRPGIRYPPDFHAFAAAGKRLMELHIDCEKQAEYPLEQIEDPKAELSFRVERMKLSKDKSELRCNDFLTLRGIPAAAFGVNFPSQVADANLRLPPRQPLRHRMGHRPVSGLHRQALRHRQRPQPRRRPAIYPPPHRPVHHRLARNPEDRRRPARPQSRPSHRSHRPSAYGRMNASACHDSSKSLSVQTLQTPIQQNKRLSPGLSWWSRPKSLFIRTLHTLGGGGTQETQNGRDRRLARLRKTAKSTSPRQPQQRPPSAPQPCPFSPS